MLMPLSNDIDFGLIIKKKEKQIEIINNIMTTFMTISQSI